MARMTSLSLFLCVLYLVLAIGTSYKLPIYRRNGAVSRGGVSRKLAPPESLDEGTYWGSSVPVEQQLKRTDTVSSLCKNIQYARAKESDFVETVIKAMNAVKKGSTLLFDDSDKLVGIFTERDYVTKILDNQRQSTTTVVKDVMTRRPLTIKGSENIKYARQMMLDNSIRHLVVVDMNDDVLGCVSMTDILRGIQEEELELEKAKLFGSSLTEINLKARTLANEMALEAGAEGDKQDFLRTGFVLTVALILAAIFQGSWIHNHEWLSMTATFALGYVGIIFENYFEFNKAAIALLMSAGLWTIFVGSAAVQGIPIDTTLGELSEKVAEVSEVVYFILGAMTIVEIVDSHQGFKVVTDAITSKSKRGLLWVISVITFFMSAILDNLTTTIVMVSLIKKILNNPDDRKLFGALIVIAANAGGAWTPIGDVTTTMLWINGQISALPTMTGLFLPSLVSVIVSAFFLQSQIPEGEQVPPKTEQSSKLAPRGKLVFATGIAGLLSVPLFKATTGLPPYLGMLASLGVMWSLTDAIHAGEEEREELMAPAALRKIDTSGVLFFLGILLSVGALDSAGLLQSLAKFLENNIPNESIIATLIGLASAVIDNVPLVAATMGMYTLDAVPTDSSLWQLIAFCAGTGGSLLIIGSAAGVALMGLEKIDFLWYAKKISLSALAGYGAGIATYLGQSFLLPQTSAAIDDAAPTVVINTVKPESFYPFSDKLE